MIAETKIVKVGDTEFHVEREGRKWVLQIWGPNGKELAWPQILTTKQLVEMCLRWEAYCPGATDAVCAALGIGQALS